MAGVLRQEGFGPGDTFPGESPRTLAAHNYKGSNWVAYDRQFRRDMLARKDLNWSATNTRLYNEAFTGRARTIPRCPHCLSEDHSGASCPAAAAARTHRPAEDPSAGLNEGSGGRLAGSGTVPRPAPEPPAGAVTGTGAGQGCPGDARARPLISGTSSSGPRLPSGVHVRSRIPARARAGANVRAAGHRRVRP